MGYRFLFVDDSATVRAFLKRLVAIAGYDVECIEEAANGLEGLKLLKAQTFDLVISDLHMPIMGGLQMVKIMGVDERLRKIPLVILSSEGSDVRLEELRLAGVRHLLRKPTNPETVKATLDAALGLTPL